MHGGGGGGGGGGGEDDPSGNATIKRFSDQQREAAESVATLVQAFTPGAAAAQKMANAVEILNVAQRLQVITGKENIEILQRLREEGGEKFLASISPVAAAYRDQRIALENLVVQKELFNLTDQEALIAGELIRTQMQDRLLQLDEYKNGLSLVESAQMGVSEGFKGFVEGLGTSFDIIKSGMTQLVTLIADTLVEALMTGQLAFRDLGLAAIQIIQQIITQLLVQIAVEAILKALRLGASGGANIDGAGANGISITPMANGGPINGSVGQTFLVGEEGPELFVPKSSGEIVPNKRTAEMMSVQNAPPVVNVQVVNVVDESGIPDAMNTAEGEQVIINTIQKNRNQLKEFL